MFLTTALATMITESGIDGTPAVITGTTKKNFPRALNFRLHDSRKE